ncbi:hypothetical protein CI109_106164 [Kwoniella shandongensis]|uniref:Uncharacterized protein n=1 Tax=Kwoniella shandongensis TaxID=1734106 RepID=A0A5M6BZJ2_9TREE|nr:uncharacterized protein CI109_003772 [Kwoniella shandongensis]KAA5527801.1 hypothetical protein CI109_003772 [Kwoniella shandongensis]
MGKIVHIVLWKLRKQAGEDGFAQAKAAIANLKTVPGPETFHLGPPLLDGRAKGFNWGLYSVFASPEALQTYAVSEAHVNVVEKHVKPNVEELLAYDFELE